MLGKIGIVNNNKVVIIETAGLIKNGAGCKAGIILFA